MLHLHCYIWFFQCHLLYVFLLYTHMISYFWSTFTWSDYLNQGFILTSEIDGTIQMKSYLTGNPEIRVALNEDLSIGGNGRSIYNIVYFPGNVGSPPQVLKHGLWSAGFPIDFCLIFSLFSDVIQSYILTDYRSSGAVLLDDCYFHESVCLDNFDIDRTLTLVNA